MFGGQNLNINTYYRDLWEYDPVTDQWTPLAHLPYSFDARGESISFVIGDTAYIGTGVGPHGKLKDFFKYDFNTDTWIQLTDFPGTAREGAFGFSLDSCGFVGGGYDENYLLSNDVWGYNPSTGTWIQKDSFPGTGRFYGVAVTASNHKAYFGTGYCSGYKSDFYEYDAILDVWTQKRNYGVAPFSTGIAYASGFAINGQVYIGTGSVCMYVKGYLKYDPVNDTWEAITDYAGGERIETIGLSIGNKGYVGLGYNNNFLSDFWEYTPAITGIDDSNTQNLFTISPNPSNGIFQLNFSNNNFSKSEITVFNSLGQVVHCAPCTVHSAQSTTLDLTNQPDGIYFVKISDGKNVCTKKVVKE